MSTYWEDRHVARRGKIRADGTGSGGRLLTMKVRMANQLIADTKATSLLDLGCGSGLVGRKLKVARYIGVDVSPTALEVARERMTKQKGREFHVLGNATPTFKTDVAISMDVIYHLLDDTDYFAHLTRLFATATKAVGVYSTDHDSPTHGHVRHRAFSVDVAERFADWTLTMSVPPRWPIADHGPKRGSNCLWMVWRPK